MPAMRRHGICWLLTVAPLILAACEPLYESWGAREGVAIQDAKSFTPPPPAPAELKVMTWNIKFAAARIDFWFDLWGDRVQMQRAEVKANLDALIALVKEVNPDLLLLQEVEINSRRSAYVDMVQAFLDATSLNHAAYFSSWKSRYVASEGLGRVDMGNAILSKFPLVQAERIALVDRSDQDAVTSAFYPHRALGRAVLDLGGRAVTAFVVHTEAYDTDKTKSQQLQQIQAELQVTPAPFVIGGDFNAIPPGSLQVVDFNDEHPDSRGTEFAQPAYDLADMLPFYQTLAPAVSLERYGASLATQRQHFTHSVIGPNTVGALGQPGFWNRTLDYLFANPQSTWRAEASDTLQSPGRLGITTDPLLLSDHCPVVGVWQVHP